MNIYNVYQHVLKEANKNFLSSYFIKFYSMKCYYVIVWLSILHKHITWTENKL